MSPAFDAVRGVEEGASGQRKGWEESWVRKRAVQIDDASTQHKQVNEAVSLRFEHEIEVIRERNLAFFPSYYLGSLLLMWCFVCCLGSFDALILFFPFYCRREGMSRKRRAVLWKLLPGFQKLFQTGPCCGTRI